MDRTSKDSNKELTSQSLAATEKISEELADVKVYFRDGLVSGLEGKDERRTSIGYEKKNGTSVVSELNFVDGTIWRKLPHSERWANEKGQIVGSDVRVHQPSMLDNQAYVRYKTKAGELRTIFAAREVTGACLPSDGQLLMDLWKKNLPRINKNGDKEICLSELVKAVEDPAITGMDAIFVATLKRQFDIISSFSESKKNVAAKAEEGKSGEDDDESDDSKKEKGTISQCDMESLSKAFGDFRHAIPGKLTQQEDNVDTVLNSWVLYQNKAQFITNKVYEYGPAKSIKAKYVLQGDTGDCYWQSGLMTLAESNYKLVKDMIRPGANGGWNVYFPQKRWNKEVVAVDGLTEVEQLLYSGAAGGGLWAGILEKAMAFQRSKDNRIENKAGPTDNQTIQEFAEGGPQDKTMHLLTDNLAHVTGPQEKTEADLAEILEKVAQNKAPMGAGMNTPSIEGLHGNHYYAIVNYNGDSKKISMFDPNHYFEPLDKDGFAKDGNRDGKFKLSIDEFRDNCDEFNYFEKRPEAGKYLTDLFDDANILKDSRGQVISVSQDEAIKLCRQQGGRLPTAREYAEYLNSDGILEVDIVDKQLNGKAPDGYYKVECINPDGKVDVFYYNNNFAPELTGEIAGLSFWTSSKVLGAPGYGHVFYGWLGGGRQSKEDHAVNYKHAVIFSRPK